VRWGGQGQAGTLRSQAISISVRGRSHRGVRSYRRKVGRLRWRPKAWQNHRVRRKGVRHLVRWCRGKQGVVLGEGTRHVRGRPHCLRRGGLHRCAPQVLYLYSAESEGAKPSKNTSGQRTAGPSDRAACVPTPAGWWVIPGLVWVCFRNRTPKRSRARVWTSRRERLDAFAFSVADDLRERAVEDV